MNEEEKLKFLEVLREIAKQYDGDQVEIAFFVEFAHKIYNVSVPGDFYESPL